ncbi:MAG TPA: ribosome maturation factor RimM [Rectinemataceae bacterium]|nr:ribosome maturation factor RimM [Rectinemataceae bacterium]
MKRSGSVGSGENRGAPDREHTGPRKGPLFDRDRPGKKDPLSRRAEATEDNPWRRAAKAIDKERLRAIAKNRDSSPDPDGMVSSARLRGGEGGVEEGGPRVDGRFAIGRLGAPRGIEGDLHVHSYSGESAHFLELDLVDLERRSALLGDTRLRLKILRAEEGPGGLTLAFQGYATREAAERLIGMEIVVDRAKAAPLGKGEWYVADLVGLSLVSVDGLRRYGRVLAVLDGAADPMLEIGLDRETLAADSAAAEAAPMEAAPMEAAKNPLPAKALVPFRKEFIGDIDLDKGRIVLVAPWVLE